MPRAPRRAIGKIAHFVLHFATKGQAAARRRKDDGESRTTQATETAVGFSCRSRPEPEGRGWHGGDNGDPVGWSAEKAAVGLGGDKETARHGSGDAADGDNFIKGDVDFDVSDPESECAVGGNVNGSYEIVPKPGEQDKVGDANTHDGSVGSDGHCGDH